MENALQKRKAKMESVVKNEKQILLFRFFSSFSGFFLVMETFSVFRVGD